MHSKAVGSTAARYLKTVASHKDHMSASSFVDASRWPDGHLIKAAVDPITSGNSSALVPAIGQDFMALVRPQTIIGRLVKLRRVPFHTRLIVQTGGARGYWVPEFGNKPMQAVVMAGQPQLPARKVAAISVISEELAAASTAEEMVLQDLAAASILTMDEGFVDPSSDAIENERPASVTFGQLTFPSAGSDAGGLREDVRTMVKNFRGDLSAAVVLMHPDTAIDIALMQASMGGASFNLAAGTGVLFGLPVLLSTGVPLDTSGSIMALIDASAIQIAGGDDAELSTSREAAILMDSAPGAGAAQLTSLWQTNCVGLLAEMFVNWRVGRPDSVVVISGANYEG